MNKWVFRISVAVGIVGIFLLLDWAIAGYPVSSQSKVVDRMLHYYAENEQWLNSTVRELQTVKQAYPNQDLKIDASVKKTQLGFYKEEEWENRKYFAFADPVVSLPIGLRSRFMDGNIYYVVFTDDCFLFKLNKSPSSRSDIYLLYVSTPSENCRDFFPDTQTKNQFTWTHRINEHWFVLSKEF